LLDYDSLARDIREVKPLIFLVGYSAYPRRLDFARLKQIAEDVGAVLMVDMAHFAGLVAGKVFCGQHDPIPYADVVTSTTHKTLRGPRGGLVLCKKEYAESVDKGCPLVIGGPIPQMIAAKAVAFKEANTEEFRNYALRILNNAQTLAEELIRMGATLVSGGTENHLILVDVRSYGLTGRQAESALRQCKITLNRNAIPGDPNGPWYTSGLRIGTPAVTSLGMECDDMRVIARMINDVLKHTEATKIKGAENSSEASKAKFTTDEVVQKAVSAGVAELLGKYPLYPDLDQNILAHTYL
jgi:glycine hydroxymethyltransferase